MKVLKGAYSGLIFLFLYAPIVVLITFSFNAAKSRGAWGGFSFRWYESLAQNAEILFALRNTLVIALLSAVIATIIGTAAALGMHHMRRGLANFMLNVTYLPVLNPDIVTGISLLILYVFIGINLGFSSLLLAHITFNIPYVILSVSPRLKGMNRHIFEAALDLGAGPARAFFKVIVPEILPGIVNGFLLAVTLSIDDFVISFFTAGPGVSTLSITIYSMARKGIKPEINALSSIMFVVVLLLLLTVNIRAGRDLRRRTQTHVRSRSPRALSSRGR
jgi:spermidine/putrescine transport system permease protein